MMAYPMQRMSAFQQQGAQPQFFGLCLRVQLLSSWHNALNICMVIDESLYCECQNMASVNAVLFTSRLMQIV